MSVELLKDLWLAAAMCERDTMTGHEFVVLNQEWTPFHQRQAEVLFQGPCEGLYVKTFLGRVINHQF